MKNLILVLTLLSFSSLSFGQNGEMRDKIESARIGLITERLNLTPEQAQKFWPVYNEFMEKNKSLKEEYQAAERRLGGQNASEASQKELLTLGLELKEKIVGLEKEYAEKMLEVISPKQLMSLRKAEEDFRRMLIEQIRKRRLRDGRPGLEGYRQKQMNDNEPPRIRGFN